MNDGGAAAVAGIAGVAFLIEMAILLLIIISMWVVFNKAGKPGWASIIPIYNVLVLAEIAGKEMWWGLLLFIPIVNIVIAVILCLGVAEQFGKGAGFGIGLLLLPFIFYPVLAFSSAQYGGQVSAPPMQRVP